ncbi:MAG: RQC-minor-1 family DNA-binding protein [Longimicrobiaceae bacterium]
MTRRVHRVEYNLKPARVRELPFEDLRAILRAADPLIARGGRSLLCKVLRGSREKKVLELGLDRIPVHGYYRGIPEDEVLARIDWTIAHGYLYIEYDYRLPLLVFTDEGWAIEKETYAREVVDGFDALLAAGPPFDMTYLKDRNRGMILRVLDLVEERGDPRHAPLLEAWAEVDYRKVRERIHRILGKLRRAAVPTLET